MIRVSQI